MKPDEVKHRYVKNDMPALNIQARIMPESFNEADRTVKVQYTAGARVMRFGFFEGAYGTYMEELSTEKGHVRLERLKAGKVPLLDSHRAYSLENVIGTTLDGDEEYADCKFSSREAVQPIFQDVKDGIHKNISVGYRVYKYEDITGDEDEIRVLRAIDWEPLEISFVPVPADGGAGVRSETSTNQCVVEDARTNLNHNKETNTMDPKEKEALRETENNTSTRLETPKTETPKAEGQRNTPVEANTSEHVEQGRKQERQRIADIKDICRRSGVAQAFADKLIDDDKTVDQARALVLDELARAADEKPINGNIRVSTPEGQLSRQEAMQEYLAYRANPSKNKVTEQSRIYNGYSLVDMARECLGKDGKGLNKMDLVTRALHTTSDFPELLSATANKSLRQGYENTVRTFLPFARQITLPDFKEMSRVALSNASSLEEVVEDGEYKRGTFGEGAEKISLSTYGKIIGITRQMIINDDLDALTRVPQKLAATAARLENRLVYNVLTSNPFMSDGENLFSAAHANTFGVNLDVAGLGALRAGMRIQKDPSGNDILNIVPRFLVAPAALEVQAAKLMADISADSVANANPYRNAHELIVDGQLDATSTTNFFMIADPSVIDTIEYAYLEGQEGPYIESRETFNRDGLEIKVRHDFATIPVDHRGIARGTGA